MQKKSTDELNDLMENMKPGQLESYFKDNEKYMADEKKAFYYYMKDVLEEKNIKLKDVYSFAGVSESYGSKIFTMEKHTKDRNLSATLSSEEFRIMKNHRYIHKQHTLELTLCYNPRVS